MSDTAGPVRTFETDAGRAVDLRKDGRTDRRARVVAGRWGGVAELRADLRPAARLAAAVGLAGIPAGVLWWLLAPVVHQVVIEGQTISLESAVTERAPAADVIFTLIMAGLGLAAGVAAWLLRRYRGVAMLAGLTLGTGLAAVLAWRSGELLVSRFGDSVDTRVGPAAATLELASMPALTVAPFVAVLVYVVATLLASREDLGRAPAGDARQG